jgi:site-specific DNA-methyltransferase (adenine-specific)
MNRIIEGDNLAILESLPAGSVGLAYLDPPFNTGESRVMERVRVVKGEDGQRLGYGGNRYRSETVSNHTYADDFDDFPAFLMPRLDAIWRLLADDGSLFVHLDAREVHYIKVLCDQHFGRKRFMNEIIWSYDYGGRTKDRWSSKHDTILWYVKDPKRYVYNYDEIDRIPYMAPRLVGEEKAARGKTPTDVWWNTIVPTTGKERTGYPTQKPLAILNRIIAVHSREGELVLDPFGGSGTTAEAAARHGRRFLTIDQNPSAIAIMAKRLAFAGPTLEQALEPSPI